MLEAPSLTALGYPPKYNIAALDTKQNKQGLMMITEENLDSDCREIHYVR